MKNKRNDKERKWLFVLSLILTFKIAKQKKIIDYLCVLSGYLVTVCKTRVHTMLHNADHYSWLIKFCIFFFCIQTSPFLKVDLFLFGTDRITRNRLFSYQIFSLLFCFLLLSSSLREEIGNWHSFIILGGFAFLVSLFPYYSNMVMAVVKTSVSFPGMEFSGKWAVFREKRILLFCLGTDW